LFEECDFGNPARTAEGFSWGYWIIYAIVSSPGGRGVWGGAPAGTEFGAF